MIFNICCFCTWRDHSTTSSGPLPLFLGYSCCVPRSALPGFYIVVIYIYIYLYTDMYIIGLGIQLLNASPHFSLSLSLIIIISLFILFPTRNLTQKQPVSWRHITACCTTTPLLTSDSWMSEENHQILCSITLYGTISYHIISNIIARTRRRA
jgi:hypothetical protein